MEKMEKCVTYLFAVGFFFVAVVFRLFGGYIKEMKTNKTLEDKKIEIKSKQEEKLENNLIEKKALLTLPVYQIFLLSFSLTQFRDLCLYIKTHSLTIYRVIP